MNGVLALAVFTISPTLDLPTAAWQMVPHVDGELVAPKVTKTKAVLCIPGLYPHPLRPERATKPEMHPWFEPKAPLLAALAPDFDVYAFGYAQTLPVDSVASSNGMRETIAKLKTAGYREIVLVGHSAGGIVAHQFAVRFPDSGVTKVIPVAAPYSGSDLAELNVGLPWTQVSYIKSLAPQPRQATLKEDKAFPKTIEYCAMLCKVSRLPNDIMVNLESQWPPEVRQQGLPAALVNANHFEVLKSTIGVSTTVDLASSKLIRWSEADTAKATAIIYSKQADAAALAPPRRERPILKRFGDFLERQIRDRIMIPESKGK